jgi:hypothetical protein
MSISHRSNRLKLVGSPSVEQLQNGRYRLSFNCVPLNPRNDWFFANKDRIFAAYGSAQDAAFTIDGLSARTGELYSNMALVDVSLSGGESPVLSLVYETLSSSFVQTKDDTIDHELNGLRRVTRESIAQAGTDFQKTVGTTSITSQIDTESAVTCILASYRVDDTDSYRKVTETYIQAGTISKTENNGPAGLPNTFIRTVVSSGIEPTSLGITLSEQQRNVNGYKEFTYRFLEGVTEGSSPDMNSLVEYETVLDVRKPGIISASKTGSANAETALLSVTPPSIGKVKALVKVELTTSNHVEIPTALNLDGVSAAAETTVTKTTPIGIDQGSNLSVKVFNTRKNTSRQSFPNHYKSGADVTATFTSASQIIKDGDNIIGETSDESTVTVITLTGTSTAPSTKGLYSQEIDPVFIDASGKQHYRRTSFILI